MTTPRTPAGKHMLGALSSYVIVIGKEHAPVDQKIAAQWLAEIEAQAAQEAVTRALIRMKQLGILVDKMHDPAATARALLTDNPEGWHLQRVPDAREGHTQNLKHTFGPDRTNRGVCDICGYPETNSSYHRQRVPDAREDSVPREIKRKVENLIDAYEHGHSTEFIKRDLDSLLAQQPDPATFATPDSPDPWTRGYHKGYEVASRLNAAKVASLESQVARLREALERALGSFHGDGITPELERELRRLLTGEDGTE